MDLSGTDNFLHLNKNRKRSKVIILLLFLLNIILIIPLFLRHKIQTICNYGRNKAKKKHENRV